MNLNDINVPHRQAQYAVPFEGQSYAKVIVPFDLNCASVESPEICKVSVDRNNQYNDLTDSATDDPNYPFVSHSKGSGKLLAVFQRDEFNTFHIRFPDAFTGTVVLHMGYGLLNNQPFSIEYPEEV